MTHYMSTIARPTQTESARADQTKNNAGGYVFALGPWQQMDRFLILGQVGSTYYATERKIVRENAEAIQSCLKEDGQRAVRRIVEISDSGRAPKNDPAIFALAIAASSEDPVTRKAALEALPKVCRTGTHLFHFAADVTQLRRWGRGLRTAVANWYLNRSVESLAMQALKYQQRDGWSHRDLLRLAHPKAKTPAQDATFNWIVGRGKDEGLSAKTKSIPEMLEAFDRLQKAPDAKAAKALITEYKLPREAVPTQFLNDVGVWEALLPNMGTTALIRNLGKMTSLDMFKPMSSKTKYVASRLRDKAVLKKDRIHPMQVLLALGVYQQGHGVKGSLRWTPQREITEALDDAFEFAFEHIEPTGKNTLIALDVSCSMDGGVIAGAPGVTPRAASAAMSLVTMRAEENWHVTAFTQTLIPFAVSKKETIEGFVKKVRNLPFGGTDCAQPMIYAKQNKLEVDVFQVYTDNETWAGNVHPYKALQDYRQASGRDAKLCVVGMTATNFTIADPKDRGMLDVVGMDSHAPALMADFARGGF